MEASRSKPKRWTEAWFTKTFPGRVILGACTAALITALLAAGNYVRTWPNKVENGQKAYDMMQQLAVENDTLADRIEAQENTQKFTNQRLNEAIEDIKETKEYAKEIDRKLSDIYKVLVEKK